MPRFWWPLAAAALSSLACWAQSPADALPQLTRISAGQFLSLAAAIDRALALSPELAAARKELAAAAAERDQAGLWQNPHLEVMAEGAGKPDRETTVAIAQVVELGGKRAARTSVAERAIAIAEVELQGKEAEVRGAVTAAYFQAVIAQERVRLASASLQMARSAADSTARLVEAGKVSPVDETRSRIAQSQASIEVNQSEREAEAAMRALATMLGDTATPRTLEEALALPPAISMEAVRVRVEGSPAYRKGLLESRRQGDLAALQRAGRLPDLTVTVGAKRLESPVAHTQAVIGVSVPLPLFNDNRAAERQAQLRADKARDEAAGLALRLEAEAVGQLARLSSARHEAEALQNDILPAAQRNHDAARRGFELGKFGFLEALDAQRTFFQARLQHLKAVAEAHRASADLARLLGKEAP